VRSGERLARWLALLIPATLLAGAWGAQLIGHLYPCEMCHWQRWPHYAALAAALLAFAVKPRAAVPLVIVATLLIATSGLIAIFHAGVEYHWWQGFTACTSTATLDGLSAAERLEQLMNAPIVRCDAAQWTFAGVSLAGFNALASLGGAVLILLLLRKPS
jgi:disulfide bond formation protein DsbB